MRRKIHYVSEGGIYKKKEMIPIRSVAPADHISVSSSSPRHDDSGDCEQLGGISRGDSGE